MTDSTPTLKALANRGLVNFRLGCGWYLTNEGNQAIGLYLQENPYAFA